MIWNNTENGDPVLTGRTPDSKFHGANMGPIWGRQDPGGPHIGPMNFAIGGTFTAKVYYNNLIGYYFGEHQIDDTAFIFALIMTIHSQN